ncbi:hypothetical protein F6455_01280 [Proteobacteria bacterium 005FR1]|nr:hypothetical protein [Proteobacteria bacterium 005FR1]
MSEHPQASAIRSVLRELNSFSGGEVDASAAMSTDGFILASHLKAGVDQDRFAAMCASLLALAEHTSTEIAIGEMRQVMVMGSNGVMLITQAGAHSVLALSAVPKARLGKILLDAKKAAARIGELLDN